MKARCGKSSFESRARAASGWPVCLLAVVLTAACDTGGETSAGSAAGAAVWLEVNPGGRSIVTLEGVRIEVAPDVPLSVRNVLESEVSSATGGKEVRSETGPEVRIDQLLLRITEGRLFIGEKDHGPVAREDQVEIRRDGVFVNGEQR